MCRIRTLPRTESLSGVTSLKRYRRIPTKRTIILLRKSPRKVALTEAVAS